MNNLRWLGFILLLLQATAEAHLLKVFAYAEGNTIHGSVYFAGGNVVEGAEITIEGLSSHAREKLKSNAKGEFLLSTVAPDDYQIQANSGDGHQAEGLIKEETFTSSQTPPHASTPPATTPQSVAADQTDKQLVYLVEQAVAKQIGPLRQSLQRNSDRTRLSDILGGIGFIFGLAGIALWWRSKKLSGNK